MSQSTIKDQTQIKRGCLLINLGSPAKAEPKEIKVFLRRFLSDPRVVTWNKALWYPILHGIVLPRRPKKLMANYQKIWLAKGSPLIVYTAAQAQLLSKQLPNVVVRHAFSYSAPTVSQALTEMMSSGITDLTILSLYPQYASSTVGATIDQVTSYFTKQSLVPNLNIPTSWHLIPSYLNWYINKLATEIRNTKYDYLVFSYHSLPNLPEHAPRRYIQHCTETTEAILTGLRKELVHQKISTPKIIQTYQSKFGIGEWLGPSTIETMTKLPRTGVKSVLICTPGFISDCIETIDEIGIQNMTAFLNAGGETFRLLPPPNDDAEVGKILAEVYRKHNPSYQI